MTDVENYHLGTIIVLIDSGKSSVLKLVGESLMRVRISTESHSTSPKLLIAKGKTATLQGET